MKEVEVIMYEANDGKLFDTKENCLIHESKEVLRAISELCSHQYDCNGCPFLKEGSSDCILYRCPAEWKIN